jgi:alkyl hydroperoxide reductase subunit AhpC
MLAVGQSFPEFSMKGVVSAEIKDAFQDINHMTFRDKWKVYFFWPKDFTFVCPTEIAEFGRLNEEFALRDTQVFGVSTDSEFVHLAWKQQKDELRDLPFPMLADVRRDLTQGLGILDPVEGVAQRATFVVDPQGVIRFVMVTDLNVGRNPKEVLRVLDALQTDELCPCNWQPGDKTLVVTE